VKATTVIGLLDEASIFIIACILKFVVKDIDFVFKFSWTVGTAASLLYLAIIPESPKWLFLQDGTKSEKAIQNLNYIAWFNGSEMRVPQNAQFDLIGQVVQEQEDMDNLDDNITIYSHYQ